MNDFLNNEVYIYDIFSFYCLNKDFYYYLYSMFYIGSFVCKYD